MRGYRSPLFAGSHPRNKITLIDPDPAKNIFRTHAVDTYGKRLMSESIHRSGRVSFSAGLSCLRGRHKSMLIPPLSGRNEHGVLGQEGRFIHPEYVSP